MLWHVSANTATYTGIAYVFRLREKARKGDDGKTETTDG